MQKKIIQQITHDLDAMQELFGDYPETELVYHTPFQLLISVILSAQTTDKQVNKVTETFYDRIRSPQDLLQLSEEEFYELIKGVNYSKTKAKNIYETARMLSVVSGDQQISTSPLFIPSRGTEDKRSGEHQIDYHIPDSLSELIKLPGVGVKTAKVVLKVLYGQPYIAVDTHVHRVSHRLGRVKNLNPEKTSEALEKLIPDSYKHTAHHVMIYFGRYLCKSQKPECERCPLQEHCNYYKIKSIKE